MMRRPEQGLRGLEPGIEASIGDRNWHAVSAQLEVMLDSLSHRSPEDLVGALGQLEDMLPDLGAEIGLAKDVLDMAPVSTVKKLAAMIFSRFLPELKNIVRRAELREDAEVKLKNLERVKDQLRELRIKLAQKIDDTIEMSLEQGGGDIARQLSVNRRRRGEYESGLARIKEALKDNFFITDMGIDYDLERARDDGSVGPFINLYEEVKLDRIAPVTQRRIGNKEIKSKLEGLAIETEHILDGLNKERGALLQPKRLELGIAATKEPKLLEE